MCLNQSELKEGLRLLQRSLRFFISLFALVNLLPLNQFNQQCERISAFRRPILTTNNCSDTTQFGGFIVFLATALHFQEEKKKKKRQVNLHAVDFSSLRFIRGVVFPGRGAFYATIAALWDHFAAAAFLRYKKKNKKQPEKLDCTAQQRAFSYL